MFLAAASAGAAAGVAAAGSLAAIRNLTGTGSAPGTGSPGIVPPEEHMIVHVRDISTGEMAIMAGTREVVYRDPEIVARLLHGSRQAGRAGGPN